MKVWLTPMVPQCSISQRFHCFQTRKPNKPDSIFFGGDLLKYAFLLLALILSQTNIPGQTIAAWDFENTPSVPSGSIAPSILHPSAELGAATLVKANSIGSPNACAGLKTWASNFWPTSTEPNMGYYFSFRVQAKPGQVLQISQFSLNYSRSSSFSPAGMSIHYSSDGGEFALFATTSLPTVGSCSGFSASRAITCKEGGTLEFRVFFYQQNPAGLAATVRIDDVTLSGNAILLPVELIRFYGDAHDQGITLQWTSISERDNARFDVERSFDSTSFRKIGEVPGIGNHEGPAHYRFEDAYPFPGINYYRLRQIDFSGTETPSDLIRVFSINTYTDGIRAFPNPCQTTLTVQVPPSLSANARLTCLSWQGKQVGSYPIPAGQRILEINTAGYPPGIYLLQMSNQGTHWEYKVVKVNE